MGKVKLEEFVITIVYNYLLTVDRSLAEDFARNFNARTLPIKWPTLRGIASNYLYEHDLQREDLESNSSDDSATREAFYQSILQTLRTASSSSDEAQIEERIPGLIDMPGSSKRPEENEPKPSTSRAAQREELNLSGVERSRGSDSSEELDLDLIRYSALSVLQYENWPSNSSDEKEPTPMKRRTWNLIEDSSDSDEKKTKTTTFGGVSFSEYNLGEAVPKQQTIVLPETSEVTPQRSDSSSMGVNEGETTMEISAETAATKRKHETSEGSDDSRNITTSVEPPSKKERESSCEITSEKKMPTETLI